MGNHKFRLSDMIPNAWFYRLKDMSKPGKPQPSKKTLPIQHHQQSQPQQYFIQHRNSYCFTSADSFRSSSDKLYNSPISPKVSDVHFPEPPRKSSKTRSRRPPIKPSKLMTSSVSADCSCRTSISSVWANTSSTPDSSPDIIIENSTNIDSLDSIPELELPPILTKHTCKFNEMDLDFKNREVRNLKQHRDCPRSSFPGVKIRASSPKIASKKIQAYRQKMTSNRAGPPRKKVAESFAIVKASFDPQRDFKESMVEMIVENNIRASKDLEDLLACYLSLNSNEYHDLIVKVFEQIWLDLTNLYL